MSSALLARPNNRPNPGRRQPPNDGAAGRLDFTVIAPAVNEAARIEGLCKELGRPLLASASFAENCTCEPLVSLGRHSLRGVAEPREIFTLPPDRLPLSATD